MNNAPNVGELPPLSLTELSTFAAEEFIFVLPPDANYTDPTRLFQDMSHALSFHLQRPVSVHLASRGPDWPVLRDSHDKLTFVDPLQIVRCPAQAATRDRTISLLATPAHPFHFRRAWRAAHVAPQHRLTVRSEPRYQAFSAEFSVAEGFQFVNTPQLVHSMRAKLQEVRDSFVMIRYASHVTHDHWRVMHDPQALRVWLDPLQTIRDPVKEINLHSKVTFIQTDSHPGYFRLRANTALSHVNQSSTRLDTPSAQSSLSAPGDASGSPA